MSILKRLSQTLVAVDVDGQPRPHINWRRVEDRQIYELIGLCKGFLADGVVSVGEAQFLLDWLETNRRTSDRWPAKVIYPRLHRMLADGVLDSSEEQELLELLLKATGSPSSDPEIQTLNATLPLSDPPPDIVFDGREFCTTGKFIAGARFWVHKQIRVRGGVCSRSPTRKTHYFVVGLLGSRDSAYSTHGREIEKAIDLRDSGKGVGIAIVSEERWAEFL